MPKTLHRSVLSLLALLAAFGPLTSEAQSRSHEKLLPTAFLLAEFYKPDSTRRASAYYHLIGAPRSESADLKAAELTAKALADRASDREAIVSGLVTLLEREREITFRAPAGSLPQWYGDYIGDLIVSVGSLTSPSAVNALVGFITTGGAAMDGLANIGAAALPSVLRVADSSDIAVRSSAAMTLGKIAAKKSQAGLTPSQVGLIRTKLLSRLADSVSSVRASAIYGLRPFNDPGIRAAILRLEADPFSYGSGNNRVYPVRDAVRDWLKVHPGK